MILTLREREKLIKLIYRFIKENNQYTLLNKTIPFNKEFKQFERNAELLENTYVAFATRYLTKGVSMKEQLKFTKFLKNYTLYDTEQLFLNFLKTKGMQFQTLKKQWETTVKKYKVLDHIVELRNELIEEYKPHIIMALVHYENYGNNPYNKLKKEWVEYYHRYQKLK